MCLLSMCIVVYGIFVWHLCCVCVVFVWCMCYVCGILNVSYILCVVMCGIDVRYAYLLV